MTPSRQQVMISYKRSLAEIRNALLNINPREDAEHMEVRTDGFDEALSLKERYIALEVVQTLKLYGMWGEKP